MRYAAGMRNVGLSVVLFLSGASAVIFESVWFQQASVTFGNSVWATSLVLCSFMGGLALGNGLVGRHGRLIARPVRFYAGLELTIGVTGFALVLLLPALSAVLAPLFRPLLEMPLLLNPLRLLVAFLLMLAPATAMGATLPFLVDALVRSNADFGGPCASRAPSVSPRSTSARSTRSACSPRPERSTWARSTRSWASTSRRRAAR